MTDDKLRRRIAIEAASLMLHRKETALTAARMRAARAICRGYVPRDQFPSEAEIRDQIERQSYVRDGDARFDNLRQIRLATLRFMRHLREYQPRIVGDVLTGQLRSHAVAGLLFSPVYESAVTQRLQELMQSPETTDLNPEHLSAIEIEFCDSAEGAGLSEFESCLRHDYPDLDLSKEMSSQQAEELDRFQVYRMLLAPLGQVQQRKKSHPEGDALYHSLQVFELAREQLPYDEEFVLAALLHDVGKGIDPADHTTASLNALQGYITERTAWFIENLHEARKLLENSIGARARRRLHQHPDYEDLLHLARCDRNGRVSGGPAPTLDEALEYVRDLARIYG